MGKRARRQLDIYVSFDISVGGGTECEYDGHPTCGWAIRYLLVCITLRSTHKAAAEEEAGSEHEAGEEVVFAHDDYGAIDG